MGVISGTFWIYDFKFNTSSCYDEMDHDNFNKWVKNKLISGLPVESIVLLHNTSKQTRK
jgi:hypothetical protein